MFERVTVTEPIAHDVLQPRGSHLALRSLSLIGGFFELHSQIASDVCFRMLLTTGSGSIQIEYLASEIKPRAS